MTIEQIILAVAVLAVLLSAINTFFLFKKLSVAGTSPSDNNARALQLQAYERMAILVERIALPSLITRNSHYDITAGAMQLKMLSDIKTEIEYNQSQQIYVSQAVWDAIKKLKEQNILLINKISSSVNPNDKGIELGKAILDFLMQQDEKADIQKIVLDLIRAEAQKNMH